MNEMRVCIESRLPTSEEACSAWFTFPIDEEEFEERIGEDTTIEKLNDLYHTFESLPLDLQEDYGELTCYFTSLDELHQHRHDVIHYSWCKNMADVARYLLDNDPAFSAIEERLTRYFDYEAYGQYLDDNGNFIETDHGIYELS